MSSTADDLKVAEIRFLIARRLNEHPKTREELEEEFGKVWDTRQMAQEFEPLGFQAPVLVATRRDTGEKGSLFFQHSPRFYFSWVPHEQAEDSKPAYPGVVPGLNPINHAQFHGVQFHKTVSFGGRNFLILTYQALNVFGMIGPEYNGVAVIDLDRCCVVGREMEKRDSGYFGVSRSAWDLAWGLTQMDWATFKETVNRYNDGTRELLA